MNPNHTWLNAASQLQDETSVYHFYKRLLALRKEHGVLISGTYELLLPNDRQIYAYLRKNGTKTALIITNLSRTPALYRHPGYPLDSDSLVLANAETEAHRHVTSFLLKPYEARVYIW
ncbi:hypothetical protein Bamy02_22900 [Bacillus amyloliquefaciens]|nr:hypothetical protein Bamy02_22900 [Bacillus amyloliquefaciens]